MALIACPDCGTSVSDRAAACVKCGYPLSASPAAEMPLPVASSGVQTIQGTGKLWKGWQLVGLLVALAGMGSCATVSDGSIILGLCMVVSGVAIGTLATVGAWWEHG